jgi:hypothetical protein
MIGFWLEFLSISGFASSMGRGMDMAQNGTQKTKSFLWIKKIGLVIIGLFAIYVIAGFFVIPPLLKPRLEKELSKQIGRKVTIEEIKLNPLNLSSTTVNLNVYETDGEAFAGFKELLVDAEFSSLFRWAATVKEIRVLAPHGILKVMPENKLNIDDIIAKFTEKKPTDEQVSDDKKKLPRAILSKLQVEDGKFTIEDLRGAEAIEKTFAPITFTLNNLSTIEGKEGAFMFSGIGYSGGNYEILGQLSVNPIRVQGSCSANNINIIEYWKHIKDQTSFQINDGVAAVSGEYIMEITDGDLNATLQNGAFEIKDFKLTEKGKQKELISLPSFSVQGISADLKSQEIVVEQVKTADAKLEFWMAPDGTIEPLALFLADLENFKKNMQKSSSDAPKAAESRPWYATIKKFKLINWGAAIEDQTLAKPVRTTADNISVKVENLENKKNSKAKADVTLKINQAGMVKVNGSAGLDPLVADLNVVTDKISIKSFQNYIDTAINAQIEAGSASSKGRVTYKGQADKPQINYQGDMSVDGLVVNDRIQEGDFIKLEQLKASGVVLNIHPNKLHADEVLINQPHARVTIDQNGTVNVVEAFTPIKEEGGKEKENMLQRLVNFLILQIQGPMPMGVDLVQLNNFSADLVDASITPSFTTHLDITEGTMTGMSSDPSARADFEVAGAIDTSAKINSSGQMNPLNAMQYTQVAFSLKDFKLPPVSPYSGKFAGYKIDEGTLHLDLKYSVDSNNVDGDNRIYVDQLTLGDKVDSPDAIDLPLALGVALLKDKNGRISLQVPVSGDVEDPKFDFGQAIKSALTGTMKDASSSPFSTISEIDGYKGDELRFVEFELGLAEFQAQSPRKLNALAKFLAEKPTLILSIEGAADRSKDMAALAGKPTEKTKASQKQKKVQKIDEKQLKQLAQGRATLVKEYLIQKGSIPEKQLKLKPVKILSTQKGNYARVKLFLSISQNK